MQLPSRVAIERGFLEVPSRLFGRHLNAFLNPTVFFRSDLSLEPSFSFLHVVWTSESFEGVVCRMFMGVSCLLGWRENHLACQASVIFEVLHFRRPWGVVPTSDPKPFPFFPHVLLFEGGQLFTIPSTHT